MSRALLRSGILAALTALEAGQAQPRNAPAIEKADQGLERSWLVVVRALPADLERRIAEISERTNPSGGVFDKPKIPKPLTAGEVRSLAAWYVTRDLSRRLQSRRRQVTNRSNSESIRVALQTPITVKSNGGALLTLRGHLQVTGPRAETFTLPLTGWSNHLGRGGPAVRELDLIKAAAHRAAMLAAHTLRTGDSDPFAAPDARVALWPVEAPTQADMLVFSKAGRILRPGAVTGLPHDVTSWFTPDFAPIAPSDVIRPAPSARTFAATSSLESARPALRTVLQVAHRIGVNYVLIARTTDIELDDATSRRILRTTGKVVTVREARAEAAGALLRVGDGAIVWRGFGTAEMAANSTDRGSWSSNTGVARDAMRFALKDLQRRFVQYRRGFEK
ncbi:MAG: hypothetical protein KGJ62_09025 [Armatimonadetes bacterium]|nr:hypothetical protein [Armatimonadota bacterium]MDE2206439.1 hypothetical protein [Armatimonadota bacterium]